MGVDGNIDLAQKHRRTVTDEPLTFSSDNVKNVAAQ